VATLLCIKKYNRKTRGIHFMVLAYK